MAVAAVGNGTVSVVLPVIAVARAWPSTALPRAKFTTGRPKPWLAKPLPVIVKVVGGDIRSIVLGVIVLTPGTIRVSVTADDGRCQITFSDSGPGIPQDVREKVFTPFFTTKSRGTGLGLPTARQLVEAHAGTIRVDCPSAGGTVVAVQLPISK